MKNSGQILAVSAVLLICSSGTVNAKALPKTAKLTPAETIVLIDIDNFSKTQQQFEKTNFYKLYKEPAMAVFFENVRTKLREKAGKLDGNNIFRTFFDIGLWPEGRTAVALLPNSKTKDVNDPEILFISQWGEKIPKIKDAINKMVEKNTELGGRKKAAETYRSVKIETIVDEKSVHISYCYIDDCFLTASDIEQLKFVIAHIQGVASPSLGDDSDYSATFSATGPDHDIDIYVNIKQIVKTALAKDGSGENRSIITSFGLDNIASASCSLGLSRRAGNSCSGKIFLKINGVKKGLCKILETESEALRVPKFIPSSAYSMTVINLNIKKAYDEIYNILYTIDPMGAAAMLTPILPPSPEGKPGLMLKNDIIEYLSPQIIIAEFLDKPFSKDSAPKETLLAMAVNNRTALEKSLSTLHSKYFAEGKPDAKRQLLGYTIYQIDIWNLLGAFSPGERKPMVAGPRRENLVQRPKFAFTITDSHLIFGREETVERTIRTLSSPAAASIDSAKWFTAVKSSIPSVAGWISMEDNSASAEMLWWLMKESAKAKQLKTMVSSNPQMMLAKGVADMADFGLLPPFEQVKKYFNLFALSGLSRPDGFFFEFNYLNPPQTAE